VSAWHTYLRWMYFNLRYLGNPPWETGITPPEVMAFLAEHPAGRALDLGCGSGTNVITLAQHGWQAVGVDFVPLAIWAGRRKARREGVEVELRVGDVTRLKGISPAFDLILDIGCYHSLAQAKRPAYWENLERLLVPSGSFWLYGWLGEAGGSGVTPADEAAFGERLKLVSRVVGEERGMWQSAWWHFKS
jgi:SAM-dependent methyltransferase